MCDNDGDSEKDERDDDPDEPVSGYAVQNGDPEGEGEVTPPQGDDVDPGLLQEMSASDEGDRCPGSQGGEQEQVLHRRAPHAPIDIGAEIEGEREAERPE